MSLGDKFIIRVYATDTPASSAFFFILGQVRSGKLICMLEMSAGKGRKCLVLGWSVRICGSDVGLEA